MDFYDSTIITSICSNMSTAMNAAHSPTSKEHHQSTLAITLVDANALLQGNLFEDEIRINKERSRFIQKDQKRTCLLQCVPAKLWRMQYQSLDFNKLQRLRSINS